MSVLKITLVLMVLSGCIPLIASLMQFLAIGFHRFRMTYDEARDYTPRLAIVVPAWNEAGVVAGTIDRLMALDYPLDCLRVYVVDDASTDATPEIVKAKELEYPGSVVHLRREKGGEGKAHTLNHGLKMILDDPWAQAILIIDADVLFQSDTLRKMTRHLADPKVGAVTAYIKEGSAPGNTMTKFIGFEYITAQAASRRAQNVFGGLACLAGGAQMHSRESLTDIGGRIDTTTLAEDTFTTFRTQLAGRRAIFEGNAIVWAEEPADIEGLWKQRLRWARGNVQVTRAFKGLWLSGAKSGHLGTPLFSFFWYTILLMPIWMILAATGLVALYFIDFPLSWKLFNLFWVINGITYLYVTLFSFAIDPGTAKKSWVQGFMFPGLISLFIIAYAIYPPLLEVYATWVLEHLGMPLSHGGKMTLILFIYAWLALGMPAAYLAKVLEKTRFKVLAMPVLYIAGFGPLLCAITFASYIAELRGAELKWDKTEKTGKVALGGGK